MAGVLRFDVEAGILHTELRSAGQRHLSAAPESSNSSRRLAAFELEDLHGHRRAELNQKAHEVMDRLGVPPDQRGIIETGRQALNATGDAFTFETNQGGRNTRPGRQPNLEQAGGLQVKKAGINVDGAVLDDNLIPFESWKRADEVQRMEAVLSHELAEFRSPGQSGPWRHADALVRAYLNPRISSDARAILTDQLRAAIAGGDDAIANSPKAAHIQAVLALVAEWKGLR